jgi:hypothetical protein
MFNPPLPDRTWTLRFTVPFISGGLFVQFLCHLGAGTRRDRAPTPPTPRIGLNLSPNNLIQIR